MRQPAAIAAFFTIGAALTIYAELVAVVPGEPLSMPFWLFMWAYYLAGLVMLFGIVFAPCGVLLVLVQERRRGIPWSAALGVAATVAVGPLLLAVAFFVAPEIRLWGLERATSRVTPAATAYLRGGQADARYHREAMSTGPPLYPDLAPPVFRVRGCSELYLRSTQEGELELSAECSRGLGAWDDVRFRLSGRYPDRQFKRIGAWAYHFD